MLAAPSEFLEQTRLADPGLTAQGQEPRLGPPQPSDRRPEDGKLSSATDEPIRVAAGYGSARM
jgi:hypothetical protein